MTVVTLASVVTVVTLASVVTVVTKEFEKDSVLQIFSKRITQLLTKSISDGCVCRTAPATPGLLTSCQLVASVFGIPLYQFGQL